MILPAYDDTLSQPMSSPEDDEEIRPQSLGVGRSYPQ
jgi:hypothetical protein